MTIFVFQTELDKTLGKSRIRKNQNTTRKTGKEPRQSSQTQDVARSLRLKRPEGCQWRSQCEPRSEKCGDARPRRAHRAHIFGAEVVDACAVPVDGCGAAGGARNPASAIDGVSPQTHMEPLRNHSPMTPQAKRPPAFPVFLLPSLPPFPRSSSPS